MVCAKLTAENPKNRKRAIKWTDTSGSIILILDVGVSMSNVWQYSPSSWKVTLKITSVNGEYWSALADDTNSTEARVRNTLHIVRLPSRKLLGIVSCGNKQHKLTIITYVSIYYMRLCLYPSLEWMKQTAIWNWTIIAWDSIGICSADNNYCLK